MAFKQAVVLAAGEGERLRPFTASKPKVMIKVANKPVLQYVVEALERNGIRRIILVVGYKKEKIMDYFEDGKALGVKIEYVVQKHLLGTGDALKQAENKTDARFLVLPGDNVIEADTISDSGLLDIEQNGNAILIKAHKDVSKYGVVTVKNGMVVDIIEKPSKEISNLVNTGIYAFEKGIFGFIDGELTSGLRSMIRAVNRIKACETHGAWLDAVYPWDILSLNAIVLRENPAKLEGKIERGVTIDKRVSIGKDSVIRGNSYVKGPVIIGENCEIGPNACVFPSTSIGNNVTIGAFTEIKNSVLTDGVKIGSFSSIQDSIFDSGTYAEGGLIARSEEADIEIGGEYHRVKVGTMVGEYCEIGSNVIAYPGTIIGNRCRIKSMKELRGKIPDGSWVV
ncbi:MAG: sugar phosphate nucleotidyltransferase [Methanophagales archaeon]|nr:sugar phosphate nucleotidyltransferase [Methanophagales archaeon]